MAALLKVALLLAASAEAFVSPERTEDFQQCLTDVDPFTSLVQRRSHAVHRRAHEGDRLDLAAPKACGTLAKLGFRCEAGPARSLETEQILTPAVWRTTVDDVETERDFQRKCCTTVGKEFAKLTESLGVITRATEERLMILKRNLETIVRGNLANDEARQDIYEVNELALMSEEAFLETLFGGQSEDPGDDMVGPDSAEPESEEEAALLQEDSGVGEWRCFKGDADNIGHVVDADYFDDTYRGGAPLPAAVDWRRVTGVVPPVVNQATPLQVVKLIFGWRNGCQCCWAVAALNSFKAMLHVKYPAIRGDFDGLALQQIVSCRAVNPPQRKCSRGDIALGYTLIKAETSAARKLFHTGGKTVCVQQIAVLLNPC